MTITGDYPTPVTVNGYSCKNCTDVDNAKKHIDPAHPRSGPYGINAKDDPTVRPAATVMFGGALSGLNEPPADGSEKSSAAEASSLDNLKTGAQLDITA